MILRILFIFVLKLKNYYISTTMKIHYLFGIILMMVFLFISCGIKHKEETEQQQDVVTEPTSDYQTPYTPSNTTTANITAEEQKESPEETSPQSQLPPKPIHKTTISRYYEEGYDKGYDDGEDDAVMDNGYGGQYDDSCPYKGQKEKDYQQGYEEGYEAGYYDNNEYDE